MQSSLLTLAFLKAFPRTRITMRPHKDADPWEVFVVTDPLPAGAHDWLADRGLWAVYISIGYSIRWSQHPQVERNATRAFVSFVENYLDDIDGGLADGTYSKADNKDHEHHKKQAALVQERLREAGLT